MGYDVMVVDDSPAMCKVIKRCLDILDFPTGNFYTANDGETGLAWIQQNPVQVLFLDLNMPRLNGFQLIEAIRKLPLWDGLTVVIVSSEPNKARIQALQGPNILFVPKPFTVEDIGEVVGKITGREQS